MNTCFYCGTALDALVWYQSNAHVTIRKTNSRNYCQSDWQTHGADDMISDPDMSTAGNFTVLKVQPIPTNTAG